MKKCGSCKIIKSDKDFYFKNKEKSLLQTICKRCMNDKQMYRWRMRKEKAIKYLGSKCQNCNKEYLKDFPLEVFQFHHKDSKSKEDNWNTLRLKSWEKIRQELDKCDLLCANCHISYHSKDPSNYSQNYKSNKDKKIYSCKSCGSKITNKAKQCKDCQARLSEKIKWPSCEELKEMLQESNYLALAKKLGVSDNAIRKRLKSRGFL